jgi:hypothetical protein
MPCRIGMQFDLDEDWTALVGLGCEIQYSVGSSERMHSMPRAMVMGIYLTKVY